MTERSKNILGAEVGKMLEGIRPGWKKILLSPELKPTLNHCFGRLNEYMLRAGITEDAIQKSGLIWIRPKVQHVFEAFKHHDPEQCRVIIIGQDPYPGKEACGLSFATNDGTIPKSLKNIYKCLAKSGIVARTGDLRNWAAQGVLMLNRYLTRSPDIVVSGGKPEIVGNGNSEDKYLHRFWGEFTDAFLRYFTGLVAETPDRYCAVLLWGTVAQETIPHINKAPGIEVMLHGHPVSMSIPEASVRHFVHCTHFSRVNAALQSRGLPVIDWTPGLAAESAVLDPIAVAIDGGCDKNGTIGAKASYGVYFPKTFNDRPNGIPAVRISGVVPNVSQSLQESGKVSLISGQQKVTPTNNRGELLAMIHALIHIHNSGAEPRSIIIVTDSEYVLHIVNHRLWQWGDAASTKANPDLLTILRRMLELIARNVPNATLSPPISSGAQRILIRPIANYERNWRATKGHELDEPWGGITMIHQNSHTTGGSEKQRMNALADQLCCMAMSKGLQHEVTPE